MQLDPFVFDDGDECNSSLQIWLIFCSYDNRIVTHDWTKGGFRGKLGRLDVSDSNYKGDKNE
ncbi:uncharacterized protein METZ01_LOCUS179861 [marine metagenome]|uniref:Uncharacterized protein n=1 Tax=marine metagenome TaxID=408172 RepID=A0A382CNX9_9ZZZZ